MIEIIGGLCGLIILLGMALWTAIASSIKESDRADRAEESLYVLNQAHQAINAEIETENQEHADDQNTISDRHHFGD